MLTDDKCVCGLKHFGDWLLSFISQGHGSVECTWEAHGYRWSLRRPRKVGLFERWLWKAHHLLQQGLSWANKDLQSLLTHKALTPKLPEFKTIQCWNFYGALFLLWLSCWWEGGRCTVPHCLCLLHAGWRLGDQEDLYTYDLNQPAENVANTG